MFFLVEKENKSTLLRLGDRFSRRLAKIFNSKHFFLYFSMTQWWGMLIFSYYEELTSRNLSLNCFKYMVEFTQPPKYRRIKHSIPQYLWTIGTTELRNLSPSKASVGLAKHWISGGFVLLFTSKQQPSLLEVNSEILCSHSPGAFIRNWAGDIFRIVLYPGFKIVLGLRLRQNTAAYGAETTLEHQIERSFGNKEVSLSAPFL